MTMQNTRESTRARVSALEVRYSIGEKGGRGFLDKEKLNNCLTEFLVKKFMIN